MRGTANTGAQANGAGSAVDRTPRTAQGLGGLVRMTGARRTEAAGWLRLPAAADSQAPVAPSITVAGRMSPRASPAIRRLFCLCGLGYREAFVRGGATGCRRTPGLPSFRNRIPAFSKVSCTCDRVEVREPMGPLKDSMRRMVPMATPERDASSICSHPMRARAARSCLPVINARS